MPIIRALDPATDRAIVADLLDRAQDYYHLWKGHAPGPTEVDEVFHDVPPGCNPAASHRLGLFLDGTLSGLAEMSFGFPTAQDAYLGLMILAPQMRGQGHGAYFSAHMADLARNTGAQNLYLAVLQANPRGAAFWARMGFRPTGVSRSDGPHLLYRLVKPL